MFGKKKPKPRKFSHSKRKDGKKVKHIEKNITDTDYVGFKFADPNLAPTPSDADKAYGISADERIHAAIFGLPGAGKSTILKMLIQQNISRKQGFMVIDPHGSLARDTMEMIPDALVPNVIYVNPGSLYRFGRTVQINPLEVKSENERYVVVMTFVNTLYNLYKDSWGPRLETVLRNAANALVESKDNNSLANMSVLMTDQEGREAILNDVSSRTVKHFWSEIFAKQYSKDAGASAYNKIDKIMTTPTVAAMLDTTESSISMEDILKNKRMLIVDLSTGASDDIAKFLGTIFLNMLYSHAKKRLDVEGESGDLDANPFYVYVDEAHGFSNSTMAEMLRSLRKFNIKMTLATQTANAYDKEFAQEITGVCKTIISGRCDYFTASILRAVMSVSVEELQRLPSHTFALFSDERGVHGHSVFRTRPIPLDGKKKNDWMNVAQSSVKKWGREILMEKYVSSTVTGKMLFTPMEACIVHMMHFDPRDWYREEIMERTKMVFPGVIERTISGALEMLVRERYVRIRYPDTDDGDRYDSRKRYTLDLRANSTYLTQAYGGRRSGGEKHNEILFRIMDTNMKRHRYCVPDLGDRGDDAPDLLIVEPAIIQDKDGYLTFDPHHWSDKNKLAVEVETDPGKHIDHSVYNYTKNIELGYDVWFVCFEERGRAKLEEAIRKKHPKFERCKMDVINVDSIISGKSSIPETFEESFHDVKVRNIDAVNAVKFDDLNSTEPHRSNTPLKQLATISQYRNTVGEDYTSPSITENPHKGDDTRDDPRLDELEWAILAAIRDGKISRMDYDAIWKMFPMGQSINDTKHAVRSLIRKGVVQTELYEEQKKDRLCRWYG